MKKIMNLFSLKEEAYLFDSRAFVLKSFCAIVVAYVIGINTNIIQLDMISVLFGLMMTLQPLNSTGIRSGLEQVFATVIGISTTVILVGIFGINAITVGLAVAVTLYVCLKINWRIVSPVAFFTAIYMTQYVQFNSLGEPSMFLTARLRLYALVFGVLIGIIVNFVFSIFGYKRMFEKRYIYVGNQFIKTMEGIIYDIESNNTDLLKKHIEDLKFQQEAVFATIELVNDMEKDSKYLSRFIKQYDKNKLVLNREITRNMEYIVHLNYDICYCFDKKGSSSVPVSEEFIKYYKDGIEIFKTSVETVQKRMDVMMDVDINEKNEILGDGNNRIESNICDTVQKIKNINIITEKIY